MDTRYISTSLTRIANFQEVPFTVVSIPRKQWAMGDYVVVQVTDPGSGMIKIELNSGRMMTIMKDDYLIGALGDRYATLEATGSWRDIGEDGVMHVLTGAGLFAKLSSKSTFVPSIIEVQYIGHIHQAGIARNMQHYVASHPTEALQKPVILLVGTSMSAGKTTTARIITRQLKLAGQKVVGAKLTGAGRYRDILSIKDAGADYIFDFVDAGLPSSIYPPADFRQHLRKVLTLINQTDADVAVVEIGASPLEPYNGDIAIEEIQDNIKCTILCASDPYAVYGVMKSFNVKPTIVSGIATNTYAGIDLIKKLCNVTALNLIDPASLPALRGILTERVGISFPKHLEIQQVV